MIDHGVVVRALPTACLANALRLGMSSQVHMRKVHPHEELFASILLTLDEIRGSFRDVVVDGQHALLGQGASIPAHLPAHLPEPWINRCVVVLGAFAVQDSARSILRLECRVLW